MSDKTKTINEILNVLYYVDEDIEKVITHNEQNTNKLKDILRKLDYVYKKIAQLENKT